MPKGNKLISMLEINWKSIKSIEITEIIRNQEISLFLFEKVLIAAVLSFSLLVKDDGSIQSQDFFCFSIHGRSHGIYLRRMETDSGLYGALRLVSFSDIRIGGILSISPW